MDKSTNMVNINKKNVSKKVNHKQVILEQESMNLFIFSPRATVFSSIKIKMKPYFSIPKCQQVKLFDFVISKLNVYSIDFRNDNISAHRNQKKSYFDDCALY